MAQSKKRQLSVDDGKKATQMLNNGMSPSQVAKYFGINKPALFKSLGIWETGQRKAEDGTEYRMHRGRMMITPTFEIKDLPEKHV